MSFATLPPFSLILLCCQSLLVQFVSLGFLVQILANTPRNKAEWAILSHNCISGMLEYHTPQGSASQYSQDSFMIHVYIHFIPPNTPLNSPSFTACSWLSSFCMLSSFCLMLVALYSIINSNLPSWKYVANLQGTASFSLIQILLYFGNIPSVIFSLVYCSSTFSIKLNPYLLLNFISPLKLWTTSAYKMTSKKSKSYMFLLFI